MPDRTTQTEIEKERAFRKMVIQGGATPRGKIPTDHLEAIEKIQGPEREYVNSVVEAHANGQAPPEHSNNGGDN